MLFEGANLMTTEVLETATRVIQRSATPLSLSQIGTAVLRERKIPGRKQFTAGLRASLPTLASLPGIYRWPDFRRSQMFCGRPLAECVEESLLRALAAEPLTAKKAGGAVKKALKVVPETRVLKEVNGLLARLAASGAVKRVAANRQAVIYLGSDWMREQVGGPAATQNPLKPAILDAIARLQSGRGNYVRVDHLRLAPPLRAAFDAAVLELAESGSAMLTRYNGPRPVAEEDKWLYVEDAAGELFIGVALPREQEV
jgi:hypothetical protein